MLTAEWPGYSVRRLSGLRLTAGARSILLPRHWAEQLSQIQIISGASVILTGLVRTIRNRHEDG